MGFWTEVAALTLTPSAVVGTIAYFGMTLNQRVFDRAMTRFEHSLEQAWDVRTSIQRALADAYEALDELIDEFLGLVDENVLMERAGASRGLARVSKLSRVQMVVDLWAPELDGALARLSRTVQDARDLYHATLLLLSRLGRDGEERESPRPQFTSEGERALYDQILVQIRAQGRQQVADELRERYPDVFRQIAPSGRLDLDDAMVVRIARKLVKQQVLPRLVNPVTDEIRAFKLTLRDASRAFIRQYA